MGVDPTISGSSILVMETGDKNLDGLIAGVEKGILVTGFNGGNNQQFDRRFLLWYRRLPDRERKTDAAGI